MESQQEPLPFVCGYCFQPFDKLYPYCAHLRGHNKACSSSFHFCDNPDGLETSMYSCRKCQLDFPTICLLHCHLLRCCGSYIYDHKTSKACPIEDLCKFTSDINDEASEKATQTVSFEHNDRSNESGGPRTKEICAQTDEFKYPENINILTADNTAIAEQSVLEKGKHKIKPVEKPASKRQGTREEKILIKEEKKVRNQKSFTPRYERPKTRGMSTRCRISKSSETHTPLKKLKKSVINSNVIALSKHSNSEPANSLKPDCPSTCTQTTAQLDKQNATKNKNCNLEKEPAFSKTKRTEGLTKSHSSVKAGVKEKKEISCEVCGKLFMDNSKLRHHMISHSDARSFVCPVCSASYKYPNHLKVHMKSHDAVKPCYCELCGEGFLEIQRLKAHKIHKHSTDRHISLSFCNQTALTCTIRLKAHKIHKHSTDRNYQCPECGLSLKFPYTLRRHMLKHSSEKAHQCEVCGQRFSRRYYLVQHMWIHNNVRRFPCTVEDCDRQFRTNYQLQCHLKLHSGERPWKCLVCPAEFIQRKELRQHLKKIHGQNLDDMAHQYLAMNLEPECVTEGMAEMSPSSDAGRAPLLSSSAVNSFAIADIPNGVVVSHKEELKSEHSTDPQQTFQFVDSLAEDSKMSVVIDNKGSSVG